MALTPSLVSEYFEQYRKNMDLIARKEEALLHVKEKKEWLEAYMDRSKAIRSAFEENVRLGSEIDEYLNNPDTLPRDVAEAIFTELIDLDLGKYDDPFYAVEMAQKLLAYFEKEDAGYEYLIPLLIRIGWEACTTVRMGYTENASVSLDAYRKVLEYESEFKTLSDIQYKRYIFVAYYNIVGCLPDMEAISVEAAAVYLGNMMQLYLSDIVSDEDRKNSDIPWIVDLTVEKFLAYETKIEGCRSWVISYFCRLARNGYKRQLELNDNDVYKISSEAVLAYQRMLLIEERCSYDEAVNSLLDYYRTRRSLPRDEKDVLHMGVNKEYYFEVDMPDALIFNWLKDPRVNSELRESATRELIACKDEYFDTHFSREFSAFWNQNMSKWCFNKLSYLETTEEKEYALFHLIINRQVATFFHSHMVAAISEMFVDAIMARCPELFVGVMNCADADEVIKYSSIIRQFVRKCALYHDLGKNRITDIITTQHRKLTDAEFEMIKRHPALGADALDEDFDDYHDVIIGHHRSYDGRSGYPMRWNGMNSKVKIITDLIAVCDSLDAATDFYGRNYAGKKDLAMVVNELKEGSGTRYNGDLVKLIEEDAQLFHRIEYLIKDGREDMYYNLYMEHFR